MGDSGQACAAPLVRPVLGSLCCMLCHSAAPLQPSLRSFSIRQDRCSERSPLAELCCAAKIEQQLQQLLDAQKQDREEVLKQLKQLELQQSAKQVIMEKLMQLVVTQQLKPTSSSLKSEQYRAPAIAAYNVARKADGVQQMLCMVSDRYFPESEVIAGHILRVDWAPMAVSTRRGLANVAWQFVLPVFRGVYCLCPAF